LGVLLDAFLLRPQDPSIAALAVYQSLDLASRGRERFLYRDFHVHVTPIIGWLVADDDVLVGRNRHPNIDTIHRTMAMLCARRDDGDTTSGDVVLILLQPLHLAFDCYAGRF